MSVQQESSICQILARVLLNNTNNYVSYFKYNRSQICQTIFKKKKIKKRVASCFV